MGVPVAGDGFLLKGLKRIFRVVPHYGETLFPRIASW
jgi:hypothetical protein